MSDINDLPGNSHKARLSEQRGEPLEEGPRKLEKIVKGEVKRKKQSWLMRFLGGDDTKNVGDFIIWDILVPAAKSMIIDAVTGALNMRFYGEANANRSRREKGRSYIEYSSMTKNRDRFEQPDRDRDRVRSRYTFDDIVLPSYTEADNVLSALMEMIEEYGVTRVADFYDAVGITSDYPDQRWGWDNLSQAAVRPVRGGGYILILPKPLPLK